LLSCGLNYIGESSRVKSSTYSRSYVGVFTEALDGPRRDLYP
jgi:hypothetical protein